jgi:hypothetical protein
MVTRPGRFIAVLGLFVSIELCMGKDSMYNLGCTCCVLVEALQHRNETHLNCCPDC